MYTHLARRLTALACFLGPALLLLGSILYVVQPASGGLLADPETFNDPIHKLEWAFSGYFGHILLLPAFFALVARVGQRMPLLAITCAAMGLPGLAVAISSQNHEVSLATVDRNGMDVSWLTLVPSSGPSAAQLIVGLPIILYFLSMVILGIGVLRSSALPRWSGVPLILAGLLQFDATGPQPSGTPLLTWLLAALCLGLVYSQVGLLLWHGEPTTEASSQTRAISQV